MNSLGRETAEQVQSAFADERDGRFLLAGPKEREVRALFQACAVGDLRTVHQLVLHDKLNVDVCDCNGITPLMTATVRLCHRYCGNSDICAVTSLREFLNFYSKILHLNSERISLTCFFLFLLQVNHQFQVMEFLLEFDADVNHETNSGYTVVELAFAMYHCFVEKFNLWTSDREPSIESIFHMPEKPFITTVSTVSNSNSPPVKSSAPTAVKTTPGNLIVQ